MCMHTHSWGFCLFHAFFSLPTGSVKNCTGAFVLLKIHLIMLGAGSLPELVGFKKEKKEEKKKALSPVTSPAIHILHSGPDFLQSLSKTALVFWGSFGSGWRMSFSKGNPQKVKSATQVGITMSAA